MFNLKQLRIAKNELKELEKAAKGKNKSKLPDITIQIDVNAKNPYAALRSELEHARDIAKGEIPNQTEKHFSRYNGLNEGEAAPDYVYKKARGKNKILSEQKAINSIKDNVAQYEADGFTYKSSKPDGWGEQKLELANSEGQNLGYVEYSTSNGVLQIDYVRNTTKRNVAASTGYKIGEQSGSPNIGEKLIDKIISDNPNLAIRWDAISEEGINFKEKYIAKHPELKDKITGINSTTLAKEDEALYNKAGGALNEGNNNSIRGKLEEGTRQNPSSDSGAIQSNSREKRIYGNNGNSASSDISANAGRKTSTAGNERRSNGLDKNTTSEILPEQLKLNFDSTLESKQSTGDIVSGIINGEIKPTTKADIETIVSKVEQLNPEISGFKWENLIKDSAAFAKKLEEIFDEEDVSGLIEAFTKGDVDALEYIARKEMAAVDILNTLAETGKKLGDNASIEAKDVEKTCKHD